MADEIQHTTHDDHAGHEHDHDEKLTLFGRTFDVPVYTGVFIILGILTIIEVAIAEFTSAFFTAPSLLALAVIKAGLVMYYYMHLRSDSRIFTAVILVPIGVALLSLLFLLAVPSTGY